MIKSAQNESMKIFDIVVKENLLPAKIDELVPLSFIGTAAVEYYKSKIKLMTKLETTQEQKNATLKDGQEAGDLLLDIESRIGELLPSAEDMQKIGGEKRKQLISENNKLTQYEAQRGVGALPEGINSKKAFQARAIKNNPGIVEEIKKEARDNEDIPTKTAVLNKIAYKKEKARREKAEAEGRNKKTEIEMRIEEQEYLLISRLPKTPPTNWTEKFFNEAKAKANIIMNRLEVFNEQ